MSDLKKMPRVGPAIETVFGFVIAAAGASGFEWAAQCVLIVAALRLGLSKARRPSSSLESGSAKILRYGSPAFGEAAD